MAMVPDIINTTQLHTQASISGMSPCPLANQDAGHYEKMMIMGRKTESNAFDGPHLLPIMGTNIRSFFSHTEVYSYPTYGWHQQRTEPLR